MAQPWEGKGRGTSLEGEQGLPLGGSRTENPVRAGQEPGTALWSAAGRPGLSQRPSPRGLRKAAKHSQAPPSLASRSPAALQAGPRDPGRRQPWKMEGRREEGRGRVGPLHQMEVKSCVLGAESEGTPAAFVPPSMAAGP